MLSPSIHPPLPSLFLPPLPPITSMEPLGLALSPHECLIRPFELLYYSAAQNYLLFLSSSQLIKKGKVLPSLKKHRLDEGDFENKLLKQGRVILKQLRPSACRLWMCVLTRTGQKCRVMTKNQSKFCKDRLLCFPAFCCALYFTMSYIFYLFCVVVCCCCCC